MIMTTTIMTASHHHHGLKHYHDEDMQSVAVRLEGDVDPAQVHALDQPPHPGAGPEHPALQGHRGDEGRPQALRVPGRAHDARRRFAARVESRTRNGSRRSCSSAAILRKTKSATDSWPARLDRVLDVTRPALSALLNQRASLSPEMALRVEKAFGVKMDTLLRMQTAYEIAEARRRSGAVEVQAYVTRT